MTKIRLFIENMALSVNFSRKAPPLIKLRHRLALFRLGDVDVGLHGGVIGVARQFHSTVITPVHWR